MASYWMSISTACKGISPFKPPVTSTFPRSMLQKRSTSIQQLWNSGSDGFRSCSLTTRGRCRETPRSLLAEEPILCGEESWVHCSQFVRASLGLQVFQSTMSLTCLAAKFSTSEVRDSFDERSSVDAIDRHDKSNGVNGDSVDLTGGRLGQSRFSKRQVCQRCSKPELLCICHHIKTVVNNKTEITILQHPQEKKHHLGSARIALLALQNIEVISIPEADGQGSPRTREKVPGSKRFIAGRGGKKGLDRKDEPKKKKALPDCRPGPNAHPSESNSKTKQELSSQSNPASGDGEPSEFDDTLEEDASEISGGYHQLVLWSTAPTWIKLKPDAGLLFPSKQAVDLWPVGLGLKSSSDSELTFQSDFRNLSIEGRRKGALSNPPTQLIILDGTWSKARRIYFENPWLQSLPHYRLPTLQDSRYGSLRREPKPGFLSTVESIVYALQLLEPETEYLESLLNVFDRMIEDQMRFVEDTKLTGSGNHIRSRNLDGRGKHVLET